MFVTLYFSFSPKSTRVTVDIGRNVLAQSRSLKMSPVLSVWQEVLACGVLLPLINQLSDPDYINQFVIWMVRNHRPSVCVRLIQIHFETDSFFTTIKIRDSSCNYEAFMNILKLTDKPAELEAVKDKVVEELQYLRSLDTAGDGRERSHPTSFPSASKSFHLSFCLFFPSVTSLCLSPTHSFSLHPPLSSYPPIPSINPFFPPHSLLSVHISSSFHPSLPANFLSLLHPSFFFSMSSFLPPFSHGVKHDLANKLDPPPPLPLFLPQTST